MIELEYIQGEIKIRAGSRLYELEEFHRKFGNEEYKEFIGSLVGFVLYSDRENAMRIYWELARIADSLEEKLDAPRRDRSIIEFQKILKT